MLLPQASGFFGMRPVFPVSDGFSINVGFWLLLSVVLSLDSESLVQMPEQWMEPET